MDPASIVGLIAFGGSSADMIKTVIKTLYKAPNEILSLHNEVSDLRLVLVEYKIIHQKLRETSSDSAEGLNDAFQQRLISIRKIFHQLAEFSSSLIEDGKNGKPKFKRVNWIRKKDIAVRLTNEIAMLRRSMRDLLGIATASRVTKIELTLKSIDDVLKYPGQEKPGEPDLAIVSHLSGGSNPSGAILTVEANHRPRCDIGCGCRCHLRYKARGLPFISHVFGLLFIGYTGLPMLGSTCESGTCARSEVRAFHISYIFPAWFIRRSIDFALGSDYYGRPACSLSVRNRVEYTTPSSIFQAARQGRVNDMKRLFEAGLASPSDVSYFGGKTAFGVSNNFPITFKGFWI